MTAPASIQEISDELKEAQKQLRERARELVKPALLSIIDKYPHVESFSWRQYTPYFNDGDACSFAVNSDPDSILVNDLNGWDIVLSPGVPSWGWKRNQDGYWDYHGATDEDRLKMSPYLDVSEMIEAVPDDVLLQLFDDHAEVTVTHKGISVDEYSHD